MASWVQQVPAWLAVLGLLTLPGLPVALCLRVGGIFRLGIAVTVSLALIATASLVAPIVGLEWSLLPVILVAAVASLIAFFLRSRNRSRDDRPVGTSSKWVWGAVILAFCGWTAVVAMGIEGPDHPNQLYDGLFHLNAVEYILQNADASPFHMAMVTPGAETAFYPTLWHAIVSLVVPLSGSIVSATNIVTVGVVALIWPVAIASVTSVVFGSWANAQAWAALASFGFSVFPLGFLNWGVLYPSLLGTLTIPLFIAVVIAALTPALAWSGRLLWILVVLAAVGAVGIAHPAALLSGIALVVPFLTMRLWARARRVQLGPRVVVIGLLCLGLVLLVFLWGKANVSTGAWLPAGTMAEAVGEVVMLSPVGRTAGLLLGPLAAIGVWQVIRMKLWWVLASYGVSIGFYLAATWLPVLPLRSLIVGVWYDDSTRVAALLAMWGLPLAGLGAAVAGSWLRARWVANERRFATALVAVAVAVAAASHLVMLRSDIAHMRDVSFRFSDESRGLSPNEVMLFEEADAVLDADSVVIGDPLTGAGLLFTYTGHDVVFPHVGGRYGADAELLARDFVSGDAMVCEAVERIGVTHAFDFGDRVLFENHSSNFEGLHNLVSSPILTQIAMSGDAALYEVTGCE